MKTCSMKSSLLSTLSISDELYRTGWLYRMLSLFTNAGPPSLLKSTDASDKQSPERIIRTAENYIRRNYNSITVSELAASLQVARSHLFKVFKKHFGISPQQYIMEMRFKHALTLLADSRLPVKPDRFRQRIWRFTKFFQTV